MGLAWRAEASFERLTVGCGLEWSVDGAEWAVGVSPNKWPGT